MTSVQTSDQPSNLETQAIELRGVRTHNLKNIDVSFGHHEIVVLTGPSGCGKSSLAFDTLFAEGKRQFLDSLSLQARQALQYLPRPDIDFVRGLQPVVCINQNKTKPNARSTVATVTEIYDFLRLLLSRIGVVRCAGCHQQIDQKSSDEIEAFVLDLPERTKVVLLAPIRSESSLDQKILEIRKAGFVRVRIGTEVRDLDSIKCDELPQATQVDAVVDRLIVKPGIEDRLSESVSHALKIGGGTLSVLIYSTAAQDWEEKKFSTQYACLDCKIEYDEIEPRTFSFNSPFGACPACEGIGHVERFIFEKVFASSTAPIQALEVVQLIDEKSRLQRFDELNSLLALCGLSPSKPIAAVDHETAALFFEGDSERLGFRHILEKEFSMATDSQRQAGFAEFRDLASCLECSGSRLCSAANNVFLADNNMGDIIDRSIVDASKYFDTLLQSLAPDQKTIAEPIVAEVQNRLTFLKEVGLGYLTLSRRADTLSGGEFQRVRLATGLGNRLTDVCYILDEPTTGLHPHDHQSLIRTIRGINDLGNSVVIVEHEPEIMKIADRIVDLGPGAGAAGGNVIAEGTYDEIVNLENSVTGQSIAETRTFANSKPVTDVVGEDWISVEGATLHNLKGDRFSFPLNRFTVVSGVSGSGKSSMVLGTLVPALQKELGLNRTPGPHQSIQNAAAVTKVIEIDQHPIGRSSRSNAATYSGVFDDIRKVFAATKIAKQRGYTANRFSFNNKLGACKSCQGHGQKTIDMSFMPDLYATCEICQGQRFNAATLDVKFKGLSIADVLDLSIDEARDFFQNIDRINRAIEAMARVGLGYLKLGQPATALSGGEAQRLKIAAALAKSGSTKTLFVLDEPSTGLHRVDLQKLYQALRSLVDGGNTVLVIEHNLDFIASSDYVIDFGPHGGAAGGFIVASGSPGQIAAHPQSTTGKYLSRRLQA